MKIQNINNLDRSITSPHGIENHDGAQDKAVEFRRTLTTLSDDKHVGRLQELIGDIDKQAAKLGKRADINEFVKYRKLIRDFMDEVISNGYEFSKENSFEARGRHRFFATVNTVNEKLDAMAKEVLESQSENINLLDKIDDIRGLLVDMML
ncbi:MAG: YaaR family protein [Oscillospiraceae bacterium]|jgi:uncharacterized protein YaaR (DUF327 family)|nr:YaaR family protein [Oscillospiraceae bacterium]